VKAALAVQSTVLNVLPPSAPCFQRQWDATLEFNSTISFSLHNTEI